MSYDGSYPQQPNYAVGLGAATTNNPFVESNEYSAANRYPEIDQNPPPQQSQSWQYRQQQNRLPFSSDIFPGGGNWVVGPNPPGWRPTAPQIPPGSHYNRIIQAQRAAAQAQAAAAAAAAASQPSASAPIHSYQSSQGYTQYNNPYPYPDAGRYTDPTVMQQFDPLNQPSWSQPAPSQSTYAPAFQNPSYQTPAQYIDNSSAVSPPANPQRIHPREYIQRNRAYLDQWDQYHWKQLFNACESLEKAWQSSLEHIQMEQQQRAQYYGASDPQLETLMRTAQNNRDRTSHCKLQLKEVHSGYQLSQDNASRDLVRDAMNAGVRDLPGWP